MSDSAYKINVVLGPRVFLAGGWKRRDEIYLDGRKIGRIDLTDSDRPGKTTSIVTGKVQKGRALEWCVGQARTMLEAA